MVGHHFFHVYAMLDKFYKRPEGGSVNRSHLFRMSHDKPGIIELKDSTDSEVRPPPAQDLHSTGCVYSHYLVYYGL